MEGETAAVALPQSMKSNLCQILPVSEACEILGIEIVERVVRSFLVFRTPNREPTNEDVTVLVKALFFDPGENDVPQNIQTNWNRLTRRTSGMDKTSFLRFMIPSSAAPFNGPGGHMGLYDCWVHALSACANNYASNAPNSMQPIILLPDVLIVAAVCQEYKRVQSMSRAESVTENLSSRLDYAIMMLSVLAFRVYDSYQKKGAVTRDTIHRFMSDVHGEDSYKQTTVRKTLDNMFAAPQEDSEDEEDDEPHFLPSLSPGQFANGVRKTTRNKHHILLDWIATLGACMIPSTSLPLSTQAYLDALTITHRSPDALCEQYALLNLYEIKRRFHSLVESTNQTIQGEAADIMKEDASGRKPKHIISEAAFLKAVTGANDELGHGGHLTEALAKATFAVGGSVPTAGEDDVGGSGDSSYWALYDVLNFGCTAVRQQLSPQKGDISAELPLIKFAFQVFGSSPNGRRLLDRSEIGRMLSLLLEQQAFRKEADSPPAYDDEEQKRVIPVQEDETDIEDSIVDVTAASSLDVLPPKYSNGKTVLLRVLIDHVLTEGGMKDDQLTFDGFCKWYYTKGSRPLTQKRLGPYLMELRLIASVLFGVPPTKASVEDAIVLEVQRRHQFRYPQTDVSRRGPRGTIWYIIDDRWFKAWGNHVNRVASTEQDGQDGRGVVGANARGLGKINNTMLLADNGSLALKSEIRWRHDYEIIPPMAWSALQAWYDGGPPIYRSVVRYIPSNGAPSVHSRRHTVRTEYEIELYPFFVTLFLCDVTSKGEPRPFQQSAPVSRVSPLRVLLVQLCKGLEVDPKYGRLWMMEHVPGEPKPDETKEDWLLNLDQNIIEQRNRRGNESVGRINLLLELKDMDSGKWPRGTDGKSWAFQEKRYGEIKPFGLDVGDGIVGLYNMGNTCYLNSSIQCLSHTPIFRDYFTSKIYLNDINTTNPVGHKGQLAQVSAVLINSIWKRFGQATGHMPKRVTAPGSYAPVSAPALTPKTFKESLGKFNDLFAGNEQHDAQELLAFLLGGLSEDLNRIVEKPYIEAPDSDGRPDSELADIWWSNHLQRELSIVVALFTGQYKSLLTCRSCKYESARFEPFSFLQLPLPEDDQISVNLVYYPIAQNADVLKYSVRVLHDGKLLDVLIALSKVLHADETGQEPPAISAIASDDGAHDRAESEKEERAKKRAQNMAVVDMRDGYIFKIAPNTWSLPDLQNKDTGEVPLLHVYELEPLPEEDEAEDDETAGPDKREENGGEKDKDEEENSDDEGSNGEEQMIEKKMKVTTIDSGADRPLQGADSEDEDYDEDEKDTKYSFLAIAQRRTELSNREMLHPFSHRVFGTPLLLRVNNLEKYEGRDLYDLVASRMRNLVPKSAVRFLKESETNGVERMEVSVDKEQKPARSSKVFSRSRRTRTLSEAEDAAAGAVPRYGFRLRMSSRDGRRCNLCPWYNCCIGCLIPDDDQTTFVTCGDSITLDWHFAVDIATNGFGLRSNQPESNHSPFRAKNQQTVQVKNHASCNDDAKKKGYGGAITLEDCLDAFAKEEKIPEAYCSRCTDFRVQTKRMSLWRLPPILIIHLKRFQFTQHMRRKLRDLVIFPVEGLDLSRIVASDTPPRDTFRKPPAPPAPHTYYTHDPDTTTTDVETEFEEEEDIEEDNSNEQSEEEDDDDDDDDEAGEDDEADGGNREDPMSSTKNSGRDEMLYDLYAVVHHQGALSGGHYVASLKSDVDGQWRLFNDAQVFELHARDVVDSSAYILFYIRRDVKDAKLQDFWDIRARKGEGMTEEEVEKLMSGKSERCVVS